jgi:hypothetical protein
MGTTAMSLSQKPQCKPPRKQPKKLQRPAEALKIAARETFAQMVASGMRVADAYRAAGFIGGDRPRWELRNAPEVNARINFLVSERTQAQAIAAALPEKKMADARLRLVRELERIAYSDLREVVQWEKRAQLSPDGGILRIIDELSTTPSAKLSRAAAAGIRSVTTKSGALKIDMHSKRARGADGRAARCAGRHIGDDCYSREAFALPRIGAEIPLAFACARLSCQRTCAGSHR